MSTSTEKHKAIVRQSIEEPFHHGNLAILDELYASEFVEHDPSNSDVTELADRRAFIDDILAEYLNITVTIDDQIAEADRVATRWTFRGMTAGGAVTITGITISRFKEGRIVEEWMEWDALGLERQQRSTSASPAIRS